VQEGQGIQGSEEAHGMTAPRTPRDMRDLLRELRRCVSEIEGDYQEAYEEAYSAGSSGEKVKVGPSDPTAQAFVLRGRTKYLLRRLNGKLTSAVADLEDARGDLADIWDQGPRAIAKVDRLIGEG
jgi:hypothetical protein